MSHKPNNFEHYLQHITADLNSRRLDTPRMYCEALARHAHRSPWSELYHLCCRLNVLDQQRSH